MAVVWQGWMGRLFGRLWQRETGVQIVTSAAGSTESGRLMSDDSAMTLAAVFRSIRIIAETTSGLPLVVYKRDENGDPVRAVDNPLASLFDKPNEVNGEDEVREAVTAAMAGWGNGYIEVFRDSKDRVRELWPVKPLNVQVTRRADRTLEYQKVGPSGSLEPVPADRLLHFRAFSLDGVTGVSPLGMAREALGLAASAQAYAGSFFSSGGRPTGVLSSDRILTKEQREKLRTEFAGLADDGGEARRRLYVAEAGLKYQAVSVSPEDMQMLQTRSFQIADIARFFGVPLFLLMETEKSTSWGTGIEQQNLAFLAYTLRPYLSRIEAVYNRTLFTEADRRDGYYLAHDTAPLLRADSKARADYLSAMVQNGLMTRNEGRRLELLPPMEGGDDLTAQVNLAPLEKLGDSPSRPPSAGGPPKPIDPETVRVKFIPRRENGQIVEIVREAVTAGADGFSTKRAAG